MKLGVIVGRFQTPYLHTGHMHLLTTALSENDEVLVVIGDREAQPTKRHPLSYMDRVGLFDKFDNVECTRLVDVPSSEDWDRNLDAAITMHNDLDGMLTEIKPDDVTLYGGRESFISAYRGKFPTKQVSTVPNVSATDIRRRMPTFKFSEDYRMGVIQAVNRRFPTSYQCVDVIPYCRATGRALFGKKKIYGDHLIFVGGHVDPSDASLEFAAWRELKEETGVTPDDDSRMIYSGSGRVPDYRYIDTEDGIMTSLFVCLVKHEAAIAGDDLDGVEWVDVKTVRNRLAPVHAALWGQVFDTISPTIVVGPYV